MPSMPEPVSDDQDDNSAAEEIVLGVETHKDVHVAAVITSLGVLRESTRFPATAAGYQALLAWAGTFGVLRRAGVECTGSYGAALARHLRAAGVEVIEVNQPDKATRRRQGKTDSLDAVSAARAVLSGRASGSAKAGDGPVEMLRGVHAGQVLRHQGPHPDDQPTRKPCSSRPIPSCGKHSLG
jgi:transposase